MAARRSQQERPFGLSVGGVLCLASAVMAWRGRPALATVALITGAVLMTTALVQPRWLRRPAAVWWRFAKALGYVNARIILTLFYVVLVLPAGALLRLSGRDPLNVRRQHTGWTPYPVSGNDPAHFRRMF